MGALKVEKREHGQFAIVNADISDVETGKWGEEYVSLSGYCGPYKPEMFAAAPELLEALRTIDVLSGANSSVGRIARAAIAKAKGVTNP